MLQITQCIFLYLSCTYLPYSTTLYFHTFQTMVVVVVSLSLPDFANSAPLNMLVPGTILLHIYFIRQIVKFVSHSLLQKIIAFCTWSIHINAFVCLQFHFILVSTPFLVKLKLFYFSRFNFFLYVRHLSLLLWLFITRSKFIFFTIYFHANEFSLLI